MNEVYEQEKILNEYLLFHYGRPEQILPYDFGPQSALDFAVRTVSEALEIESLSKPARALDLGCAVGRSSFELSKHCEEVIGIDYSRAFVEAAETIQQQGSLTIRITEEGARCSEELISLPDSVASERVRFAVGDAHHVDPALGSFDVVHAANLLCRMHTPASLLKNFSSLVRPGGQLILATPCTWLEEFTPRENWLGGGAHNSERTTLETLHEILDDDFEFAWRQDLPMLIRETARKFQWTVSECSRWIRK